MAVVTKVRRLSNPQRRKNAAKRRMTPKQIKHFGTKAQKRKLEQESMLRVSHKGDDLWNK